MEWQEHWTEHSSLPLLSFVQNSYQIKALVMSFATNSNNQSHKLHLRLGNKGCKAFLEGSRVLETVKSVIKDRNMGRATNVNPFGAVIVFSCRLLLIILIILIFFSYITAYKFNTSIKCYFTIMLLVVIILCAMWTFFSFKLFFDSFFDWNKLFSIYSYILLL